MSDNPDFQGPSGSTKSGSTLHNFSSDLLGLEMADFWASDAVVILGAGASIDFNFPDWDSLLELMQLHLEEAKSEPTGLLRGLPEESIETVQSLIQSSEPEETLDLLVERAVLESKSPEIEAVFRRVVGQVLLERERTDSFVVDLSAPWPELLAEEYWGAIRAGHSQGIKVGSPKVISFNYDRSFQYHFDRSMNRLALSEVDEIERIRKTGPQPGRAMIHHPHGSLGRLSTGSKSTNNCSENRSSLFKRDYGSSLSASDLKLGPRQPYIFTVDSLAKGEHPSYKRSNHLLKHARKIIIIGLSVAGIRNCHLEELTSKQLVYITDKSGQIEAAVERGELPLLQQSDLRFLKTYVRPLLNRLAAEIPIDRSVG